MSRVYAQKYAQLKKYGGYATMEKIKFVMTDTDAQVSALCSRALEDKVLGCAGWPGRCREEVFQDSEVDKALPWSV